MRVVLLAALAASVLGASGGVAQGAPKPEPRGVRESFGYRVAGPFGTGFVSVTDDGLVQFSLDDRLASHRDRPREPDPLREFYLPDDVLEWTASVNALLAWMQQGADGSPPQAALGNDGGVVISVIPRVPATPDGRVSFGINRCRRSVHGSEVTVYALASIAAQFRRAALEAQAAARRNPDAGAIWYEHAVACPARLREESATPAWPASLTANRPHQELVQLVVSVNGAVEAGSERFMPSIDARLARAIRAVLPAWRFTPALRGGQPVRQLAHVTVGFTPPVVTGIGRTTCPAAGASTCDSLFAVATADGNAGSIMPQGDGAVRIASSAETNGLHLLGEHRAPVVQVTGRSLGEFVDAVERAMPGLVTSITERSLPDAEYATGVPVIGAPDRPGLSMWLSPTGWIRAGYGCGRDGQGSIRFMELTPTQVPRFLAVSRSALERLLRQPQWAPRGSRPFAEHELSCDVSRDGPALIPALFGYGAGQASIEVLARFVVDSTGRVEAPTIETMPGPDSAARRLTREALEDWLFLPAVAEGRRVRAQVHVSVVLRPLDADAVVLAHSSRPGVPDDTLRRTIFFRPNAPPDRPRGETSMEGWREVDAAMQPFIAEARRTWPYARDRFVRRTLPPGYDFFVTARLTDPVGRQEQVFVRVERIEGALIHGRVQSEINTVSGWRRGDRFSLNQADLIDWTIVAPDGTEEGNVVGRFLDTWYRRR